MINVIENYSTKQLEQHFKDKHNFNKITLDISEWDTFVKEIYSTFNYSFKCLKYSPTLDIIVGM